MSPEQQRLAFRKCLDPEMRTTVRARLGIADDSALSVNEMIEKIREWLREQRNIVRDKVAFQERKQKEGESFNKFFVALNDIAANCNLCKYCSDDRFITSIIAGVCDPVLREKLLE